MNDAHVVRARRGAVGLALLAGAAGACFPDYDFTPLGASGPGGSDATIDGPGGGPDAGGGDAPTSPEAGGDASLGPNDGGTGSDAPPLPPFDAASMVVVEGGTFVMDDASTTLTHAFLLDSTEVTVGRFRAFVTAGLPLPCGGAKCSLDPNGPYAAAMTWTPEWNGMARENGYTGASCGSARYTNVTLATYGAGHDDYPMGCMTWFQAVAFCAFEGKRLPTETEWEYAARARGDARQYPWGNDAPVGCGKAIWFNDDNSAAHNGCAWPKPVASARDGGTPQGALDLAGGVYEWVWDEVQDYPGGTDYVVGQPEAGTRGTRGGSFGSLLTEITTTNRDETPSDNAFTDVGFRCAKTVP
jgi:formylglycine-generating enzyme required for sulfatase activity